MGTQASTHKTTYSPIDRPLDAESTTLPALILGSQTIKADDQSEYTQVNGQTSTPGSTTGAGSGNITILIQVLQDSSPESFLVSGPSSSLLSLVAVTSTVSKIPQVTMNVQTLTANSLGQYTANVHTLTPGSGATASSTVISLGPKGNGLLATGSIHVMSANATNGFSAGPVPTKVQVFNGGVLGARDELWSPSILFLVWTVMLLFR